MILYKFQISPLLSQSQRNVLDYLFFYNEIKGQMDQNTSFYARIEKIV